jgi:hypothetical protein
MEPCRVRALIASKNMPTCRFVLQPGHQSYSRSYEWDLNGVVVQLNTEELGVMLKTSVAPPASHHMAKYSLRSEDERNELFEA